MTKIAKDDPGVGDVHAGGAVSQRRARSFRQVRGKLPAPEVMTKREGAWSLTVPITKTDDDQRLVFGWASVIEEDGNPVVDSQGDVISEGDLEKAFYGFAEEARVAGEMHERIGVGPMVECMVFTKEKQEALGIDLKKVGAWVGFRVEPEVFAKIKSGEYRAFSIGGSGRRVTL